MRDTNTSISREDHFAHMKALAPYIDSMTDADEFEQSARALYDFAEVNYLSEEFQQAYCREIKATLEWLQENVKIKTEKQKVVTTVKERKYLEYPHDRD